MCEAYDRAGQARQLLLLQGKRSRRATTTRKEEEDTAPVFPAVLVIPAKPARREPGQARRSLRRLIFHADLGGRSSRASDPCSG